MSTECLMNPDFLIEFIEMYRSLPCLWKVKSSDYSNRQKKTEAYEKLLGLCKSVCPSATIELVKHKIANLRTVFKKELKKVESSIQSGASGDEVYIPRLWYFDLLKFTIDQDTQPQPPPVYHYPEAYDVRQEEENTDDSLESAGECTNFSQVIITKKKMSAEIFMNPDFLKEFIEMYRSFPCLWKVKCADYSNRQKKAEAYEKLVKLCKTVCPSATVDLIKHKIANLRTVFKKELKKVESSRKSGASGDDVYIPRLWYFDLLKFTIDQEEHTQSISNYPETYDVRQEEENTDDSLESAGENTNIAQVCIRTPSQEVIEIQQHQQKQQPPPIPMPSQKKRKPVSDDLSRQLLSEAAAVLNQKEDEFDAFGVTVAAKLRKMDDKQRLLSEVLITDILFKGMMKKLTEESSISLFQMPHYACQPPSCSNSIDYNIQHAQAMTPPRQDYVSINHEYSCSPTRMRVNPSFCMSPLPNSHVIEPSQYKEEHL
ncbi:uncharacterized protein LOC120998601 isoform X1 [Bufo bufo]|uniref:uncharacterized protein LOC120998601 isoform X1 n=1 Tax=Bufo bufo TaxID=8384 RepID=UPI001ABDF134|nr:uncharacterized protein LOC120998601 isoform X1 [Bufo bufo]XP_040285250.1 uncharacterized protein LOC120998601 isoform X1 [Bufo bufo]